MEWNSLRLLFSVSESEIVSTWRQGSRESVARARQGTQALPKQRSEQRPSPEPMGKLCKDNLPQQEETQEVRGIVATSRGDGSTISDEGVGWGWLSRPSRWPGTGAYVQLRAGPGKGQPIPARPAPEPAPAPPAAVPAPRWTAATSAAAPGSAAPPCQEWS